MPAAWVSWGGILGGRGLGGVSWVGILGGRPGGMCPRGVCPGGMWPGGVCPGGVSPGGTWPGGVSPGGVSWGLCPGGVCPGRGSWGDMAGSLDPVLRVLSLTPTGGALTWRLRRKHSAGCGSESLGDNRDVGTGEAAGAVSGAPSEYQSVCPATRPPRLAFI